MWYKANDFPKPTAPDAPIINFVGYWQVTYLDPASYVIFRKALKVNGQYISLPSATKAAQAAAEEYLDSTCPNWRG